MGTSQKDQKCHTCGEDLKDCIGHYGYIDLELPVFHVGYFRAIINVLQSICKNCSRILLKPELASTFREKTKNKSFPYLAKKGIYLLYAKCANALHLFLTKFLSSNF